MGHHSDAGRHFMWSMPSIFSKGISTQRHVIFFRPVKLFCALFCALLNFASSLFCLLLCRNINCISASCISLLIFIILCIGGLLFKFSCEIFEHTMFLCGILSSIVQFIYNSTVSTWELSGMFCHQFRSYHVYTCYQKSH